MATNDTDQDARAGAPLNIMDDSSALVPCCRCELECYPLGRYCWIRPHYGPRCLWEVMVTAVFVYVCVFTTIFIITWAVVVVKPPPAPPLCVLGDLLQQPVCKL
jgi:hypothetical protein